MTVETDKSRRQFLGDGSKTKFPVDFRIYAAAEVRVYVDDTLKTLNVDYTISNIDTDLEAFDVDFVTAPAANAVVTVSRSLARVQNTDYVEGDDFPADAHEDALDRLVMIVQELDDKMSRASVYPETEAIAFDPTLPSKEDRASKFAAWDADGNPIAADGTAGTPASAFMATVLDDPDAETARETLGAASQADLDTAEADITALDGRVQALIPSGTVWMFAGAAAPTGWLLCDGAEVSRTIYADLFAVIGTTFGAGDGSTTFNLPDFRGRSPLGVGQGDTAEGGGTGTDRTLGQKVGAETHTLTIAQMPSHSHGYQRWQDTSDYTDGGSSGAGRALGNFTSGAQGSGEAHNNMHPSLAVNFIIKY